MWGIDANMHDDLTVDLDRIGSDHFALMVHNGKTPAVFVGGELDGLAYFPMELAGDRYCLTATGVIAHPDGPSLQPAPRETVSPAPREKTASIYTMNRLNDHELVALVLGVEPDDRAAGQIASAMGLDGWRNGVPLQDVARECGAVGHRRLQRLEAALELGRRALLAPMKTR